MFSFLGFESLIQVIYFIVSLVPHHVSSLQAYIQRSHFFLLCQDWLCSKGPGWFHSTGLSVIGDLSSYEMKFGQALVPQNFRGLPSVRSSKPDVQFYRRRGALFFQLCKVLWKIVLKGFSCGDCSLRLGDPRIRSGYASLRSPSWSADYCKTLDFFQLLHLEATPLWPDRANLLGGCWLAKERLNRP